MSDNGGWVILLIALALVFGGGNMPAPAPGPTPSVVVSPEMQRHVEPLRGKMAASDSQTRKLLADGFRDLAEVLAINPGRIKTTSELSGVASSMAQVLSNSAALRGKVPGFSAAVEDSFRSVFGTDTGAVEQAKAIEFLQALAWACGG
jgi:hypothetical protein